MQITTVNPCGEVFLPGYWSGTTWIHQYPYANWIDDLFFEIIKDMSSKQ